jgi:hypothetical protein
MAWWHSPHSAEGVAVPSGKSTSYVVLPTANTSVFPGVAVCALAQWAIFVPESRIKNAPTANMTEKKFLFIGKQPLSGLVGRQFPGEAMASERLSVKGQTRAYG